MKEPVDDWASYLHEPSFTYELSSWGQDPWDTGPSEAVLNGEHLLEVVMLSNVFIDVGGHSSDLGRGRWREWVGFVSHGPIRLLIDQVIGGSYTIIGHMDQSDCL